MKRLLLAALLACLASRAGAQIIYEGFNYSAGTNTAANSGLATTTGAAVSGTGLTGNWTMNRGGNANVNGSSFASGSLGYGTLPASGGKLQWDGVNASGAAGNILAAQLTSSAQSALGVDETTKTLWMSYLVNANNTGFGTDFGVYLRNNAVSGDSTGASVFGFGLSGTNARLYYNNTSAQAAFSAGLTTTYWLVGNLTYSETGGTTTFSSANLWVFNATSGNPPASAGALGAATVSWSGTSTSGANRTPTYLSFHTNSSPNDPQFDEVRIGDSYLSVVPEPGTWTLLAGGLTTLVLFRRRRA